MISRTCKLVTITVAVGMATFSFSEQSKAATCSGPVVIAHRGVGVGPNENTLWSVGRAAASGAGWIETDVRTTRDRVPVIMHDATINRTTYQVGAVAQMTWRQLHAAHERTDREQVPSELQFLRRVQATHLKLLLELKAPMPDGVVRSAVRNVFRTRMWRRTVVHSFSLHLLRVARSFSTNFGKLHGVAPLPIAWLSIGADSATIDQARAAHVRWWEPVISAVLAQPDLVAAAQADGLRVVIWTADTSEQWSALRAAGVNGIITDKPAKLRAWECGG